MREVLLGGVYFLFGSILLFLPLLLIVLDLVFLLKKQKRLLFELVAFGIGHIYMAFCWWIWEPRHYSIPLNIYGINMAHEPVNMEEALTLMVISGTGYFGYFLLKYKRSHMPPLEKALCIAGIYGGAGLNIIFLFQILCGAAPEGYTREAFWNENLIYIGCEAVIPTLFLLHAGHLFWELVKEVSQAQQEIVYEQKYLQYCNRLLEKGTTLFWAGFLLMIPLYGVIIVILCLFGQKPDSVIEAFTKTSDWILSKEIAPPPVEYDTHYLCTVSLRGHKNIVKPIRYGIRRGTKIVVNRQLCVANAFEQLIEERTPRLHRVIRNVYDTHGYPISKWIKSSWSADCIYFLMKPLEWFFILVLYLLDEKPEDRICRQYLPGTIEGNQAE